MRIICGRMALGLILMGGALVSTSAAEESARALPVLQIKGEVVSLDANDPTVALLKVKDRYGFETPIYVTAEAKITQGETAVQIASITSGTSVEVEYNFDVNTAKRHAVSVKLAALLPQAAAAAMPAASSPVEAAPAAEAPVPPPQTPPATPGESAAPTPSGAPAEPQAPPSQPNAPPATQ